MKLRNMTSLFLFNGNRILLLYRIGSRVIAPSWCGIGGHFEENELNDPLKCVLREAHEEVGLNPSDLCGIKLRYVTLSHRMGELRQNYYFFARLSHSNFVPTDCDEGCLKWMETGEIEGLEMPYTAKQVLLHYLKRAARMKRSMWGWPVPTSPWFFKSLRSNFKKGGRASMLSPLCAEGIIDSDIRTARCALRPAP